MNIRFFHLVIFTSLFLLTLVCSRANAASVGASVYSISSEAPLFTETGVKVTTITKGYTAANEVLYKKTVQTVSKKTFLTAAKFALAVSKTPWTLAALAAWEAYDYYYNEETGQVEKAGESIYSGNCYPKKVSNLYGTSSTICAERVRASMPEFLQESMATVRVDDTHFKYTGWSESYGTFTITSETSGESIPLTDDELFEALGALTPSNDWFENADGSVNQDFFPSSEVANVQEVDPDEQALIDLFGQGLLQSTDPTADNYVTPDKMQEIEDAYNEQNKTDEEKAEDLTAAATEPMTRDEYAEEQALKEERLDKQAEDFDTTDTTSLDDLSELDTQFDNVTSMFDNLSTLPDVLPSIPTFQYSASCRKITISADVPAFGIVGSMEFPSDEQCAKILMPFKDQMGWFCYMSTFFLIILQLYREVN